MDKTEAIKSLPRHRQLIIEDLLHCSGLDLASIKVLMDGPVSEVEQLINLRMVFGHNREYIHVWYTTAYSKEDRIIPAWNEGETDFYGNPHSDLESYIEFYFYGAMAFPDQIIILDVQAATREDMETEATMILDDMNLENQELSELSDDQIKDILAYGFGDYMDILRPIRRRKSHEKKFDTVYHCMSAATIFFESVKI